MAAPVGKPAIDENRVSTSHEAHGVAVGAGRERFMAESDAADPRTLRVGTDGNGAAVFRGALHTGFVETGTLQLDRRVDNQRTFPRGRSQDDPVAVTCNRQGFRRGRVISGHSQGAGVGREFFQTVRDCESLNNFEHGIESWDGAAVILTNNRCEGNSRNGIHADNGLASATIDNNQLLANREFGLVLASATGGKVSGNTARGNLLGGIVIRTAAGSLPVSSNQALLNEGPGLVLESGLAPASYASNSSTRNKGQQVLASAELSQTEPNPEPLREPVPSGEVPRATVVEEPAPR
ncbi:MAG: right-handed parallel beta-helix repeat-containing protein [Verrucomicrobiaceae bacterium]|nr:MAG: right-handed parallel beta-helix repeat-containing protein [Verrucomicrobiaceae bacterium]